MKKNGPTTPAEYLGSLSEERRAVVSTLRDLILENLPPGYEEAIRWGMLSYEIPLTRYPKTYNKEPLQYAALASQKQHFSLYLTCIYAEPQGEEVLRSAFERAGKKLDMGKSCVRFRRPEDLPLDVIASTIASTSVDDLILLYEKSRTKDR